MFRNRHRRSGGRWLLHLAGIIGGYLLGRESGKFGMMQSRSADQGKRSMYNEPGSNPGSGSK